MGGLKCFRDLFSKSIWVRQSDRLAPQIHQSTESLQLSIRQNNPNRRFGLSFASQDMPLHESRRKESHHSFLGVPEGCFLRSRRLRALLPTVPRAMTPIGRFPRTWSGLSKRVSPRVENLKVVAKKAVGTVKGENEHRGGMDAKMVPLMTPKSMR